MFLRLIPLQKVMCQDKEVEGLTFHINTMAGYRQVVPVQEVVLSRVSVRNNHIVSGLKDRLKMKAGNRGGTEMKDINNVCLTAGKENKDTMEIKGIAYAVTRFPLSNCCAT